MARSRRRRSRRRGPNPALVAAAIAVPVVVVATVAAFGIFMLRASGSVVGEGPREPTGTGLPGEPSDSMVAPTNVVGLVVDPSGSNGGTKVAEHVLAVVARALTGWAGEMPTDLGNTPGTPGLDLVIRQVSTNSYAASAQVAHIRMPAVPALPARPDLGDFDATVEFQAQVGEAKNAWAAADAAAKRAVRAVEAAQVPSSRSEIAGAVSAMAQVLPSVDNGTRSIVIVSDLEQAGAKPNVAGDLTGVNVYVSQRCDHTEVRCAAAKDAFSDLVADLGGAQPEFTRIETLSTTLPQILRGDYR